MEIQKNESIQKHKLEEERLKRFQEDYEKDTKRLKTEISELRERNSKTDDS
jgi:hypothetical protein